MDDVGVAAMGGDLAAASAKEPGSSIYTWVDKWKGLRPGQEIPPVDIIRALKFQQDGGEAQDRFELDVVENDGDPKFLRNQLVQKWVVPWSKKDTGYPMAWCCICGNEAWPPAHFYSNQSFETNVWRIREHGKPHGIFI